MGFLDRLLGPGDREAFAEAMLRALGREMPGRAMTYDAVEFAIRLSDGGVINLHNFWSKAEGASRAGRGRVARRVARSLAATERCKTPERWGDAAALLMPRLHARVWYGLLDARARAAGTTPMEVAHEPLGEHYAVELVCDFPETVRSVLKGDLARWGKTYAEAMMTATRNLRARPLAGGVAVLGGADGEGRAVAVMTGDTFDATRILLVDALQKHVGWRFDAVALPVHRGALFLADPDDPASLSLVATLAGREFDKPYPDACVPVRQSFGEWVPWLPDAGRPARAEMDALVGRSVSRDYEEQREALDAANVKEGRDVFVGKRYGPTAEKRDTLATWLDSVTTWLPQADLVSLGREKSSGEYENVADVRWDRFVEIAGASMRPLEVWPPRWEVRDFPDAAMVARLVEASKTP